MSNNLKRATAISLILLTTMLVAAAIQGLNFASAQGDVAIYIMETTPGGTTNPAPGTTNQAPNGTNIVISATANAGYEFLYWVVSGNVTPGHTEVGPTYIIDPDTGEIIGSITRPPTSTAIDSLAFSQNPANITCGYGYTFQYQAVFMPKSAPSPTAPPTTAPPTAPPTTPPTPSPSPAPSGLSTEVIIAIVVIIIIIIIIIAALVMRRGKK